MTGDPARISVAEFQQLPRVRVVCDLSPAHRKPAIVADYVRLRSGGWALEPADPRARLTDAAVPGEVRLRGNRPVLDVSRSRPLDVFDPARTNYPNACPRPRCTANQPFTAETLGRLLDGAAALGRDVVSLRELAAWAQRLGRNTP